MTTATLLEHDELTERGKKGKSSSPSAEHQLASNIDYHLFRRFADTAIIIMAGYP